MVFGENDLRPHGEAVGIYRPGKKPVSGPNFSRRRAKKSTPPDTAIITGYLGSRVPSSIFVIFAIFRASSGNRRHGVWRQADDSTELRELLATMRATLGPEHPETLVTAALLARVLFFADREEALELEEQAHCRAVEGRAKVCCMNLNSYQKLRVMPQTFAFSPFRS